MKTFLPSIFYRAPMRSSALLLALAAIAVEICARISPDQAVALMATAVTVMLLSVFSLPLWMAAHSGE